MTNRRDEVLLDTFVSLDVLLANTGDKPIYIRGEASSIVDLTFTSKCFVKSGLTWEVCDNYTHSDHQAIFCVVTRSGIPRRTMANLKGIG